MMRVGVEDTFGRSGKVPALLEFYGLTAENIACKAKEAIAMKK
jgi:transketolase